MNDQGSAKNLVKANEDLATTTADRVLGCVYGGAIGDAMGSPYEGRVGPVEISAEARWQLSDDTQLTLCVCEAISDVKKVDPASVAAKFAEWFRLRRFTGLGASTFNALSELAQGGHWALVGRRGEMAAGNGAACRAAPLAFCLSPHCHGDRRACK